MSAYDLGASQASPGLGPTGVSLSTSVTGSAAYCRPLTRSTSSASTVSQGSTDLQLGKLDVKQLKTQRSGQSLLASELKRSATRALLVVTFTCSNSAKCRLSNLPVLSAGLFQFLPKVRKASSVARSGPAQRSSALQPSLLLTRHLVTLKLQPAASPTSANTSPMAVPPKRQHTGPWETAVVDQPDFVPPHLLSAQTMPSDFVYALGSRPVSGKSCCPDSLQVLKAELGVL